MSHKATNWAIQQRGLKPATKLVLWHLCDRHNPDFGCFPSQAQLSADAELSPSALNEHLRKLEDAGLIRRRQRIDPQTKRQMATRYILAFEAEFAQEPSPDCGHGTGDAEAQPDLFPAPESGDGIENAVSGFAGEPSPDFAASRLRNPESNLVREPLKEPVKEKERARDPASDGFEGFFDELLRTLGHDPDGALPDWWLGWPAREHVRRWMIEFGFDGDRVLAVAAATRKDHPEPPDGPRALDRAMQREFQRPRCLPAAASVGHSASGRAAAGRKGSEPDRPSSDKVAAFHADWVNSDRFLPSNAISTSLIRTLLDRGLVTEARLRERGL